MDTVVPEKSNIIWRIKCNLCSNLFCNFVATQVAKVAYPVHMAVEIISMQDGGGESDVIRLTWWGNVSGCEKSEKYTKYLFEIHIIKFFHNNWVKITIKSI